jgi:hypothetical protein
MNSQDGSGFSRATVRWPKKYRKARAQFILCPEHFDWARSADLISDDQEFVVGSACTLRRP